MTSAPCAGEMLLLPAVDARMAELGGPLSIYRLMYNVVAAGCVADHLECLDSTALPARLIIA